MNRYALLLAVVGLLSMLGGVLLFNLINPGSAPLETASSDKPIKLQAIPLTDLRDQQSLVGDRKGKILVVNFWAPWCAPCRREIPSLIKIQEEYASQGVEVLGIAIDSKPAVSQFADEYQINYPLFLGGSRVSMYNAAFGNPSGSLPFTALVNRDQDIVFRHNGEISADQLREQLKALL